MGTKEQAAVRRAEILEKAAELFREKGFSQVTTGDLTGALGISRGLLYYHFKDLEDVAAQLVSSWGAEAAALAEGLPYRRELGAEEKLELMAAAAEALPRGEDPSLIDRLRRDLLPRFRRALLPILREGAYEGRFQVEDDLATADFLAAGLLYAGEDPSGRRRVIRALLRR